MRNNFTKEIVVSSVLIVLTVLLLNPFNFWMPEMMVMLMLALTFIAFALFAIFVLREKVQDERELAHRMLSGRVAFLVGSALLTLGIIIQSFNHSVDPWLVVTLVLMILSKIFARLYGDSRW
jgi:divalent metal cation (Fe/Co/Zn/Cd) transporter